MVGHRGVGWKVERRVPLVPFSVAPQRWFVLQIDSYSPVSGASVVADTRAPDYCYWKIMQSSLASEYRFICAICNLDSDIAQLGEEGAEGVASMRELPFVFAGEFGEGEVEGRDEEEGVVAEAVGAAGMVEELAFDGAVGAEEDAAVAGEGQGADEAGGSGELVLHEVEEESVVALVGSG